MASLCLLWGHKGAAFGGSHGPGRTRLAPTYSGEGWAGKVAAFRVQSAAHQVSRGMVIFHFLKQWNTFINARQYTWHIHDTTLTAESEEEWKSLLMKVKKENKKAGLKLKKLRSWHLIPSVQFSSVVPQSCPTLCDPMNLSMPRPPCPSPTPGAHPNSCPLSQWCHPTISSSVVPFSCLKSFPASGSFPISQFFTSGDQDIGVSASVSILPMNI